MQIETERLIFRKWEMEDADALVDALNDFYGEVNTKIYKKKRKNHENA